jgi:CRISPR/Cas system CSM-associated protein Csm4 (group 5 of RAMP superfamily)
MYTLVNKKKLKKIRYQKIQHLEQLQKSQKEAKNKLQVPIFKLPCTHGYI